VADQNPTFVLPDPAFDKARGYMRGLRRAVLSFWYATLEDSEAATLEATTASLLVNILDEAVFEESFGESYREIRARDRLGRVVTGLELIRNCETHAPLLAEGLLVEKHLLGVPLLRGGQIMRCVYAWAEYDNLPVAYRTLDQEANISRQRARGEVRMVTKRPCKADTSSRPCWTPWRSSSSWTTD
jgi:hypothetical protein